MCDSANMATPDTPPPAVNSCRCRCTSVRPRRLHGAAQRRLDRSGVVEMLAVPEIDDEVSAGVPQTVALDEVIGLIAGRDRLTRLDLHLRSGVWRLRLGVHPNLGKRVPGHRSHPSNQQ